MGDLISKPEPPLQAFFQGAGAAALSVGIPVTGGGVVLAFQAGRLWHGVLFGVVFTCVASVVAGLAWAGWRMVQLWAYDKFTS